jgi:DNA-binding transcriptional LysR family regulator
LRWKTSRRSSAISSCATAFPKDWRRVWDDLRFVLALQRAGSLGAAARLLKVEQSTVSRRLSSLEAAVGAALVARTPEGVVLNEAGSLVASVAAGVEAGVEGLVRRIGGEDLRPEGIVRLATTEAMATFLLAGLVPLRREHPRIQVQLVAGSAALDLLRREADLAVRLFREKRPELVTRKVGDIGWSLYASHAYVARTGVRPGAELDASTLAGLPIVGYSGVTARAPGALWLAEHGRAEDVVLTGESIPSVLNAVKAGIGLSALPCFAAEGDALLVRLRPSLVARGEAFLVIPPDHRETVRVRLVMDAVTALFERERKTLEGAA